MTTFCAPYPPGLRENGGHYNHAAMWTVLALAKQRDGGKAAELFAMLNQINRARTPENVERYKVEPYVVAADIHSVKPHVGRGGWTWYTGSAAWMYRAGIEGILGIRRDGKVLTVCPCIPASWPGFKATVTVGGARCAIQVIRGGEAAGRAVLDGVAVPCVYGQAAISLDG